MALVAEALEAEAEALEATKRKSRPILFSGPMIRALLAGRKTQTRRLVSVQPVFFDGVWQVLYPGPDGGGHGIYESEEAMLADYRRIVLNPKRCPYGRSAGDRLWVRETWRRSAGKIVFAADVDAATRAEMGPWNPSIFMSRSASRIELEVVELRAERLHEISEADARAEGVRTVPFRPDDGYPLCDGHTLGDDDGKSALYPTAREAFEIGWDTINGKRAPWAENPWVWVVTFQCTAARYSEVTS